MVSIFFHTAVRWLSGEGGNHCLQDQNLRQQFPLFLCLERECFIRNRWKAMPLSVYNQMFSKTYFKILFKRILYNLFMFWNYLNGKKRKQKRLYLMGVYYPWTQMSHNILALKIVLCKIRSQPTIIFHFLKKLFVPAIEFSNKMAKSRHFIIYNA